MFNLRKAQMEDSRIIYELRNDPQVRANSFSGDIIPYDSHLKWFESSLKNERRRIFLVEEDGQILGVIRFDLTDDFFEALVSINVSTAAWGKGIGTFALQEGEKILKKEFVHLKGIIAKVMDQNEASKKLFTKCDYMPRTIEFFKEVK